MGLLDNVLTGLQGRTGLPGMGQPQRSGMSPMTMALLGLLAYRTMKGKGRLADMLGTGTAGAAAGGGGLGAALGGLLSGGALSGGLNDLLEKFRESGHGDKAQSWVSSGPNAAITPQHLEEALGAERIAWLEQQTGISKEELLQGLSQTLPETVNKLTPDGRMPTPQEAQQMVEPATSA
jgi:uncharacterized protein YidB (DUF937 family)